MSFIERLSQVWAVRCVILHGSFATGRWITSSDLDLVVIADGMPERFRDRLRVVFEMLPRRVPIEVLCYTPKEFDEMLDTMHVTALEATSRGIPLTGADYFSDLRARMDVMTQNGLRRGKSAWYWERG